MSAPRASTSSRAASWSMRAVAGKGGGGDPGHGVGLVDAGELDEAAPVAEGLADALVTVLVLHVHVAEVGGDVDVVGEKDEDGLRIGTAAVVVEGGELFFFGAAGVELLQVADEEDLEGRHEGRGLCLVEHVEEAGGGEVEVVEAEVAEVGRPECVEDGVAAAVGKKRLVSDEDVAGAERGRLNFGEEAVGRGEAAEWGAEEDGGGIRMTPACR